MVSMDHDSLVTISWQTIKFRELLISPAYPVTGMALINLGLSKPDFFFAKHWRALAKTFKPGNQTAFVIRENGIKNFPDSLFSKHNHARIEWPKFTHRTL